MAEVLSQNQIDALLNAAKTGDSAPQEKSETADKYRKYDFYSPRKFTKDRLRIINGVFENYTRVINSRINGLLHTSCEIAVEGVEEQRYYEFSNALTEGEVIALSDMYFKDGTNEESNVLFHFSTPLMLSMMDRLMGGTGEIEPKYLTSYTFTDLELQLYESIVQDLINVLGTSWESYVDVSYKYRRTEINPTLVQLLSLDETVVIVSLNIDFPNANGRMNICLPGMLLTNIFSKISSLNKWGRTTGEDNSDDIMDILKTSELELTAELARTQVKLSDINSLRPGDVIDLSHPVDKPIFLCIGGKPWFSAKMGAQNNNIAVKIKDTYHNHGRRDE